MALSDIAVAVDNRWDHAWARKAQVRDDMRTNVVTVSADLLP